MIYYLPYELGYASIQCGQTARHELQIELLITQTEITENHLKVSKMIGYSGKTDDFCMAEWRRGQTDRQTESKRSILPSPGRINTPGHTDAPQPQHCRCTGYI